MRLVRKERSGWRDLRWSLRQRCYGYDAPLCDIDTIAYEDKIPIAIFEDVSEYGKSKTPQTDSSISVIRKIADGGSRIPFYGRRYADDFSWMTVRPLNHWARMRPPPGDFGNRHSEADHVVWRYDLAGRRITRRQAERIIADGLSNNLDQPERRSAIFSDLDDPNAIDRDVATLLPDDLIKLYVAMRRRLGAGHEPG